MLRLLGHSGSPGPWGFFSPYVSVYSIRYFVFLFLQEATNNRTSKELNKNNGTRGKGFHSPLSISLVLLLKVKESGRDAIIPVETANRRNRHGLTNLPLSLCISQRADELFLYREFKKKVYPILHLLIKPKDRSGLESDCVVSWNPRSSPIWCAQ